VSFYTEGLGLRELFRFADHDSYTGVMLGLPGVDYHLEFTSHVNGSPGTAPSQENLLVLYLGSEREVRAAAQRLESLGHHAVEAENPWWPENGGITIEDPDGWRIVLMPAPVF
jgi:catechol 2,3-dioxygenase-like lactoylglutathione lyase family enzyme